MPPQPSASTLALPNFSSSRRRRAAHFRFGFGIIHIFFSLYALLSELFLMTLSTLVVKTSSMLKVA